MIRLVAYAFSLQALFAGVVAPSQEATRKPTVVPVAVASFRDSDELRFRVYQYQIATAIGTPKEPPVRPSWLTLDEGVFPEKGAFGDLLYWGKDQNSAIRAVSFVEVEGMAGVHKYMDRLPAPISQREVYEWERDDFCATATTSETKVAFPAGRDPEEFLAERGIADSATYRVVESPNGGRYLMVKARIEEYYRFHDGVLFSADFRELGDIDLPSKETLTSKCNVNKNVGFSVRLQDSLAPVTAESQASAMQILKRSPFLSALLDEDFGLAPAAVLKSHAASAIASGIAEFETQLHFLSETHPDVGIDAHVLACKESDLEREFKTLSSAESRMSPVLKDESAGTLHICFKNSPFTLKATQMLHALLAEDYSSTAHLASCWANSVSKVIAQWGVPPLNTDVELLFKISHTPETDGVIYGGLRLNSPELNQKTLEQMFPENSGVKSEQATVSWSDDRGVKVVRISVAEESARQIEETSSLRITDVYLAYDREVLWYAIGNAGAVEKIHTCVALCAADSAPRTSSLLTFDLDAGLLISYPRLDPVGVGGLLQWCDQTCRYSFLPPPNPFLEVRAIKAPRVLDQILNLGGPQTVGCRIDTDGKKINMRLILGECVVNYLSAVVIKNTQASF